MTTCEEAKQMKSGINVQGKVVEEAIKKIQALIE